MSDFQFALGDRVKRLDDPSKTFTIVARGPWGGPGEDVGAWYGTSSPTGAAAASAQPATQPLRRCSLGWTTSKSHRRLTMRRHPGACLLVAAFAVADAVYHLALREPLRVALGCQHR